MSTPFSPFLLLLWGDCTANGVVTAAAAAAANTFIRVDVIVDDVDTSKRDGKRRQTKEMCARPLRVVAVNNVSTLQWQMCKESCAPSFLPPFYSLLRIRRDDDESLRTRKDFGSMKKKKKMGIDTDFPMSSKFKQGFEKW